MNLARKVEGRKDPVSFGRPGSPVVWHRAVDQNDFLETLADWVNGLMKKDPYKLIALLCRYPKQAMELKDELERMISCEVRIGHRDQFSFEPGVIISNSPFLISSILNISRTGFLAPQFDARNDVKSCLPTK